MRIGRFQVDALNDGCIVAETAFVYPTIAPGRWGPHAKLLRPDGRILNELGAFLIRDGRDTILVDNGVGPDPSPPFSGGGLLPALARHGLGPPDITVMVFTHLHFDHIGWTTRDGAIVFENARHLANRDDWEYFFSGRYAGVPLERPEDFPIRRLAPLADRIELWKADEMEIVTGIALRRAEGHTPGHAVIELARAGSAVCSWAIWLTIRSSFWRTTGRVSATPTRSKLGVRRCASSRRSCHRTSRSPHLISRGWHGGAWSRLALCGDGSRLNPIGLTPP